MVELAILFARRGDIYIKVIWDDGQTEYWNRNQEAFRAFVNRVRKIFGE